MSTNLKAYHQHSLARRLWSPDVRRVELLARVWYIHQIRVVTK